MSPNRVSTLEFPSTPLLPRTCEVQVPQPPSYVLTAITAGSPSRTSFTVTSIVNCITEREKGMRRVFRVNVSSEAFQEPRQLICKVALGRRWFTPLQDEALLYEGKLKPLQGTVVPRYYGFFAGDTYKGKTGIMILEDCGQPASGFIYHQPFWFRKLVLKALVAVHRVGIVFQDPMASLENNVVVQYDSASNKHVPRFIAFSMTNVMAHHHNCQYESDDVEIDEGTPEPKLGDVSCQNLWRAFLATDLFSRPDVYVLGKRIPSEYATDVETLKAHVNASSSNDGSQSEFNRVVFERRDWLKEREMYGHCAIELSSFTRDAAY
ncbi:hypothetical protein FKP32DRAFT_1681425 [Trametes sanguinea]|nr:hypothetical protein FKP32DRAFT_1681425 [Trametes sanguinea]